MTFPCDLNDFVMRECEVIDTHLERLQQCPSKLVLDIGYGDGRTVAYFLAQGFHVKAVDIHGPSEAQLRVNLKTAAISDANLKCEVCDLKDYPFEPSAFAVVVLSHVLHFVQEDDAQISLARAATSVAPNGQILIRAHHESHPLKHDEQRNQGIFRHFFSKQEIEMHFQQNFRLLHSADLFGMVSPKDIKRIIAYHHDNNLGEPEEWMLNEHWRDVEYLYQRIS